MILTCCLSVTEQNTGGALAGIKGLVGQGLVGNPPALCMVKIPWLSIIIFYNRFHISIQE